jgi:hypothetical protein
MLTPVQDIFGVAAVHTDKEAYLFHYLLQKTLSSTVLHLVDPLLCHTAWLGNFYNSPVVTKLLNTRVWILLGLFKHKRKGWPNTIDAKLKRANITCQHSGVVSDEIHNEGCA